MRDGEKETVERLNGNVVKRYPRVTSVVGGMTSDARNPSPRLAQITERICHIGIRDLFSIDMDKTDLSTVTLPRPRISLHVAAAADATNAFDAAAAVSIASTAAANL